MLKAVLHTPDGDKEVKALNWRLLGQQIASEVICYHSNHPGKEVRVTWPDHYGLPLFQLKLTCLRCGDIPAAHREWMCPQELVSALTLVFHTSHEGHPIKLEYMGMTWESPV